jgi:outer membrane protein OmpA-like peptidoglycan-associated protein
MRLCNIILLTVITLAAALPAAAQPRDVAGSKAPALLTRMPNFYISEFKDVQFDAHEFVVAKGNSTVNQHVEGHLTYWRYDIISDTVTPPSWLQIFRNHENAVQKLGGKTMSNAGPGNNYDSTFLISKNGTDIWIELHPRGRSAGSGMYTLVIVEVQKMQQDVVANADALKSGLADSGHVEVPGIFFDTAKSVLKPESDAALNEIAKLLQANPALKVWVVGHTDAVGSPESNMALSNARAASVIQALTQKNGIDAKRLAPFGAGPYAPVASNDSEEGRAKNRRVELVKHL